MVQCKTYSITVVMVPSKGIVPPCHQPPLHPPKSEQMDDIENVEESQGEKKKRTNFEHIPGRSAFPVARVQKILKADTVRWCEGRGNGSGIN